MGKIEIWERVEDNEGWNVDVEEEECSVESNWNINEARRFDEKVAKKNNLMDERMKKKNWKKAKKVKGKKSLG